MNLGKTKTLQVLNLMTFKSESCLGRYAVFLAFPFATDCYVMLLCSILCSV